MLLVVFYDKKTFYVNSKYYFLLLHGKDNGFFYMPYFLRVCMLDYMAVW